jgi:protein tyrosine/serine phosphatase
MNKPEQALKYLEIEETFYKKLMPRAVSDGYIKDRLELIGWLKELVEAEVWIPVTERLPERLQNVLIHCDDGQIRTGVYTGWDWTNHVLTVEVTHWRPLPAPPMFP